MKPPSSPLRFQSTHRHYHRHHSDDPEAWNNWVGGKKRSGRRGRLLKRATIALGILAFAALVGLIIYEIA
jgi:hypothetical protein